MRRREFFKYATASLATPFLFQGQWINAMANTSVFNGLSSLNTSRKLILIQLNGGNDGLNMLIPITEYDKLANARLNILIAKNQILKLTDETGLHPSMPELTKLYQKGMVQFIQGVGYPNPNFSHFRSKDIVLTGSDSNVLVRTGWVGRMFGQQYPAYPAGYPNDAQPYPIALTIGSTCSSASQGEAANFSAAITNVSSSYTNAVANQIYPATPFGKELQFITKTMEQTGSYLSVIKAAAAKAKNLSALYPAPGQNALADQLKLVANLIAGGLQTQVYVVNLGGWDLHAGQVTSENDKLTGAHPMLLSKLSKAIEAFQDDLRLMNKADETLGLVYTEFGRRIISNDSLGTDHGTTWPAIVFGSKINPGIIGNNPFIPSKVTASDNLPMQNDVRSIYASLFKQWFAVEDKDIVGILGKSFPQIQVVYDGTGASPISAGPVENPKLWPNPVENNAQLSFEGDGELIEIRIYNLNGQWIENHPQPAFPKGSRQIQLQLGHLRKGAYQLVLQKSTGTETVRFVVM